ncbi:hypothetical protein [Flagellimonas sp.]|uniref:hypothetical protein n=1 Tax=Flagellimonas sp. TaxID=2058762 RepID=UPI003F4A08B5
MQINFKLLLFLWVLSSFIQQEINGYITLFEDSSSAKYYRYGKTNYFEYFDNQKENFDGNTYYVRYRKYGWGDVDTTYYRKGKDFYFHFDKKTSMESKLMPVQPRLGDKWEESDGSWSYEVIETNKKFKTPKKKYMDCVKVHCLQLTNKNKEKSKEYFLFYSPKYGYVGNTDADGNVLSYLSQVKLNAKTGDKMTGN